MRHAMVVALLAAALVALGLAIGLAGCSGSPPPVTGLVVAIDYDGAVATVAVTGAALATGRHFGPYQLSTASLASGGTVGLVFDPSDAGDASICAEARDAAGNRLDFVCQQFAVQAGAVGNGTIRLRSPAGQRNGDSPDMAEPGDNRDASTDPPHEGSPDLAPAPEPK
jgi:hypothetical protein